MERIGVVEAERMIPCHSNTGPPRCWLRQRHRRCIQVRGAVGQGQQAIQIHMLPHQSRQHGELFLQSRHLCGSDQSQVPAFQGAVRALGEKTVDMDAGFPLDSLFQPGIEHGRDPVQEYPLDIGVGTERGHPLHQCRRRQSPAPPIQHQHRRRSGLPCQIIGTGVACHGNAVVVAHDPLDDADAAGGAVFIQQGAGGIPPQEKQIQIPRLGADDLAVEHGVDIVRPALKGNRLYTPLHQSL